mgnify:CR=1 FL=1
MSIGHAIRAARTIAYMTQKELAERCDISPSWLSLLERGERGISVSSVDIVAEGLNLTSTLLVFMSEPDDERFDIELKKELSYELIRRLKELRDESEA